MTRRRVWSLIALVALVASGLVLAGAAPASAGFTTYTGTGISQPFGMAAAPDGHLWFTNFGSDSVGEVDPATGTVTNHTGPSISDPVGITVAPDGVVWFANSGTGTLGKIDGGVVSAIAVGMDGINDVEVATTTGDIWFSGFPTTGDLRIGRYHPATNFATAYAVPGQVGSMTPDVGDGMWFTWFNAGATITRVRHISEAGALEGLSIAPVNDPTDLTTGPDGKLWFTAEDDDLVVRLNQSTGVVTTFSHPQVNTPNEIISGPGGDLWFTNRSGARLGRIDPATGAIVTYRDPTDTVEGPIGLAVGGDGNLWYTRVLDGTNDLVGRFTLGNCDGRAVTVDLGLGSRPTAGADVIRGTAGADTISAAGGNDVVCGGAGNDRIAGGAGKDRLLGDAGADALDGGAEPDYCDGGLGRDTSTNCERRVAIP